MKFSCDRCQTRYSIGDEKVRGKVLKIRCKTCGNILVVREPGALSGSHQAVAQSAGGAPAAAAPRSSTAAPSNRRTTSPSPPPARRPPPRGADVDWYVAIKGKQHGPAKRDDVTRLYREGRITERTYLWNETMSAWTRLREVPQFSFLLEEARPAPPPKRPPPPPPSEEGQAGAEIIPFDEAKRARESATGIPVNDPFAAVSNPGFGDQPPRDSTRVFIMQAGLQNRAKKQRMYAGVAVGGLLLLAGVCFLDYNEVIEIPGLHSAIAVVAQKHDDFKPPEQVAWDSGDEDPKLKCKLMPDPALCEKKVRAQNAARHRARAAGGVSASDLSGAFNTGGGSGSGGVAHADVGGGLAADISAKERASLALLQHDEKHAAAVTLHAPAATKTLIDGSDLDPENVAAVVKQNQPAIQDCIEKAAKSGSVPHGKKYLVVGVEPNGRVSGARFEDALTQASPGGECIVRAAKKWKFAPFPGPPTDARIPLILSLN